MEETVTETRPIDLRRGLDRLSRGLIAYGIVALVVAAISFGALIWVNGRIGSLRTEVTTTVGLLATTTADTASTLRDASTTAQTFSDTLGQAANSLPAMSDRIHTLQAGLDSLETTLRSVSILGAIAPGRRRRFGREDLGQPRRHRPAAVAHHGRAQGQQRRPGHERRIAREARRQHAGPGDPAGLGGRRGFARRRPAGHRRRPARVHRAVTRAGDRGTRVRDVAAARARGGGSGRVRGCLGATGAVTSARRHVDAAATF